MTEIILFVGENCPACRNAETFLKKRRIQYQEVQVEKAMDYARALGVQSVPTLIVRDSGGIREYYPGFQSKRYEEIISKYAR